MLVWVGYGKSRFGMNAKKLSRATVGVPTIKLVSQAAIIQKKCQNGGEVGPPLLGFNFQGHLFWGRWPKWFILRKLK